MGSELTDRHMLSSHSEGNKPTLHTLLFDGSLEPWSDDPQASILPAKVNRRSEAHILEQEASILGKPMTAFQNVCAVDRSYE